MSLKNAASTACSRQSAGRNKAQVCTQARRAHVKEWEESTLRMSEYCRSHKLALSTFSAWASQYSKKPSIKESFGAVALQQEGSPAKPQRHGVIQLALPNGILIKLDDATSIRRAIELSKGLL